MDLNMQAHITWPNPKQLDPSLKFWSIFTKSSYPFTQKFDLYSLKTWPIDKMDRLLQNSQKN